MVKKKEYVLSLVIVDTKRRATIAPEDIYAHITVDLPDGLEVEHYKVRQTGDSTESAWIPVTRKRRKKAKA